ncbi:fibronectin type III domain-containing protein [Geobacillus sp. TFV-3]|uniref:fibronectin type III domain-containing protein n=1 Tax=Geobacillus sp. TFV-3 TaxID=1897059 RepID=UPI001359447E|nr:hypothetical protein [Geobacillus sp. TFV-3]KAF0994406.1 hypothetical protein BJQ97_01048 [Geobacillus sp. TFV-3]
MRLRLISICIFFVAFSKSLVASAAVTSGYVSPGIISAASNYEAPGSETKTVDSNLNTSYNLAGNGYVTYSIPVGSTSMKIHFRSLRALDGRTASYRLIFSDSKGIVQDSGVNRIYTDLKAYDFAVPSSATKVTVKSESRADYFALIVHEVEFVAPIDKTPPHEVTNVVTSSTDTAINLTFYTPNDSDFAGTKLYVDGVLVAMGNTKTSYQLTGLKPNTTYNIRITTFDTNNNESDGITMSVKTLPPADVTNLELHPSTHSILAQWINPESVGFMGNDLYLNGNLIVSLDKNTKSYTFLNLHPNTSYEVKIVSKYNEGYSSLGKTAIAKTTIPVEDITDLRVDAKYDRVKLSWTLPDSEFFRYVKIYRKKVKERSFWNQLFGATSVSAATTSDGYTPMFETNGTYWTDLTVTPDTTYSYKVKSVNTEGNESQGVTIETTTPSEPVPKIEGVSTTQNKNGDYVVTWTSPSEGIVKVVIGGKEYTVVDAATQQVMIPKEDMKTDFFGGYDAKLVPIGKFGTEGHAVQVPTVQGKKIEFPILFDDFVKTVINILTWAAPLILLSLVFIFWRPFITFLRKTIFAKGGRIKS